jgi:hypothetical protein
MLSDSEHYNNRTELFEPSTPGTVGAPTGSKCLVNQSLYGLEHPAFPPRAPESVTRGVSLPLFDERIAADAVW